MDQPAPKDRIIHRVAFFGDAHTPREHPDYKAAYKTAQLLAKDGYTIVNGGGPGIMDASTQGAASVGGQTMAVIFKPKEAGSFEGGYLKNLERVNKELVTENYIDRMFGLIENSDSFVIFRGGSGTLSELGTVWVLANIYYGHHKPFILYGGFWWEVMDVLQKDLNIDKQEMDCFKICETPEEVSLALQQFDWEMEQIDHTHCRICGEKAFMT